MDVSAVVLNKVLGENNLEIWSRLKLLYLDPAYSSLYTVIHKYYDTYSKLPNFEELEIQLRSGPALRTLAAVKLLDVENISAEVALDALIDQYTQNLTIDFLDKFLNNLPMYSAQETKDGLAEIVLKLDEKTFSSENVYSMSDLLLFRDEETIAKNRVYLGLNNTFDSMLGGVATGELILQGGHRGSGKSISCSNIQTNQYESGFVCPYFTIEMSGHEVMQRNMAMHAQVSHSGLKKGTLADDDWLKVVKARAAMFLDAEELVQDFIKHRNRIKFEKDLVRSKKLKDEAPIIIDDRALTITAIDLHLGKIKAKYGDKFKLAVVDYVNQVVLEGATGDKYDWKTQIVVATKLKELARKHDVAIYAPYQTDESGEARFARGILDPADIALKSKVHDKSKGAITYETTKIRGGAEAKFTSPIDWDTLRISPNNMELPDEQNAESGEEKPRIKRAGKKKENLKQDESSTDIPWN